MCFLKRIIGDFIASCCHLKPAIQLSQGVGVLRTGVLQSLGGALATGRSQASTTSSRGLCSPAQTLKVLKTVQGQDGPTDKKPQRWSGH